MCIEVTDRAAKQELSQPHLYLLECVAIETGINADPQLLSKVCGAVCSLSGGSGIRPPFVNMPQRNCMWTYQI